MVGRGGQLTRVESVTATEQLLGLWGRQSWSDGVALGPGVTDSAPPPPQRYLLAFLTHSDVTPQLSPWGWGGCS